MSVTSETPLPAKKTGGFYVPPDVGTSMESITFHTQAAP